MTGGKIVILASTCWAGWLAQRGLHFFFPFRVLLARVLGLIRSPVLFLRGAWVSLGMLYSFVSGYGLFLGFSSSFFIYWVGFSPGFLTYLEHF